jgi:hypothetical protein
MTAAVETGFVTLDEKGQPIGTGREGCLGYLKWSALHQPKTFLGLLGRIIPLYIVPDIQEKTILTHEETLAQLRERGLPEELIDYLRKAPDELQVGENPDPYGMKDVTPNGTGK